MKSKLSPVTSKPPRLRVDLKDVNREEFSAAVSERLGKQRVSIMLDGSIIAFFKAKAGERGYLTLISASNDWRYTKNGGSQPRLTLPLLWERKCGNDIGRIGNLF